uniref:Uncharacterized protein n=1 Tax=Arundo donax TaxID=35708 RepID=A0A0A9A2G8_ARUDO
MACIWFKVAVMVRHSFLAPNIDICFTLPKLRWPHWW